MNDKSTLASNLVSKLRAEVVVPYKDGYEPLRAPPSALMTQAADEIERAGRIMRRAISWLQIKEAAFATHKGPAIIEEMQRFVGGLPDETSDLAAEEQPIFDAALLDQIREIATDHVMQDHEKIRQIVGLLAVIRPAVETTEHLVWGLESRHEDGDWLTYYALYPTRAQAQTAAGNGHPVGVEWRVVEYRKVSDVEPSEQRSPGLPPVPPPKCSDCGVYYIAGARHFSGCKFEELAR